MGTAKFNTESAALVRHLARLARIGLTPEEEARYEREFQTMIEFVGQVESTHGQRSPLTATISGVRHVVRDDHSAPSSQAAVLLDQAPETERGAVKVPPVL